ncbi:MAG: glycosyltransferase [Deltaproteobacteria bacterium]|nr:glycosyltransferase [Deltaproteobacteria bacterium]
MSQLEFELVLPCYNEGKTLERLLREVVDAAKEAGHTPSTFQLVLVQNGSSDNTSDEPRRRKAPVGAWYRVVDLKVNQGYGGGLWAGLSTTTARFVAWSHADMQCSPRNAFRALSVLKTQPGKTLVRGYRTDRDAKDRFVSHVFEFLSRVILGMRCHEVNAQPKVFRREFLKELKAPPPHFGFDLYALYRASRAGFRQEIIPVSFPPRISGVSHWAHHFFQRYRTVLSMVRFMGQLLMTEGRI